MAVGIMVGDAEMQDGSDHVQEFPGGGINDDQEQLQHIIVMESNENWPSVPDETRPRELIQMKTQNGTFLQAKIPEYGILAMYRGGVVDDLTGQPLPDNLVAEGKKKGTRILQGERSMGDCPN